MSVRPYEIIKCPILSEESQIQQQKGAQYTFKVVSSANKNTIREAIEALFPNVRVRRVNTMNYRGKTRRQMMTRKAGKVANWKKAIVTLRAGDSIDLI